MALFLSNAPVGSSAKMTLGLFIKDLKIAILSFSPPDRSAHFLLNNSLLIEKLLSKSVAFFSAVLESSPFINAGSMTLYKAVWLSNK